MRIYLITLILVFMIVNSHAQQGVQCVKEGHLKKTAKPEQFKALELQLPNSLDYPVLALYFKGEGDLTSIAAYRDLEKLHLYAPKLKTLPTQLSTLSELVEVEIYLAEDMDMEQVMGVLATCRNLERLTIQQCNLTSLPKSIGQLKRLQILNLSHNKLDSLPNEISKLSKLRGLNVAHNYLTKFPQDFGKLDLQGINIQVNSFDSIPPQVEQLYLNLTKAHEKLLEEVEQKNIAKMTAYKKTLAAYEAKVKKLEAESKEPIIMEEPPMAPRVMEPYFEPFAFLNDLDCGQNYKSQNFEHLSIESNFKAFIHHGDSVDWKSIKRFRCINHLDLDFKSGVISKEQMTIILNKKQLQTLVFRNTKLKKKTLKRLFKAVFKNDIQRLTFENCKLSKRVFKKYQVKLRISKPQFELTKE